jgi:membrane protein DedA with SNARE-associated domain
MGIVEYILSLISSYGGLASFLGGFFAGEEVIMTLSFLSANGIIPIWKVFLFSFLGIVLCDTFFYALGRMKIVQNISSFKRFASLSKKYKSLILKLNKKGTLNLLFTTKFIFGTRILTLLYLGFRRTKLLEFFISDLIVGLFWMVIVVSLGWFSGSSFYLILNIFKNVQVALLVIVLLILTFVGLKKWISTKILKKQGISN